MAISESQQRVGYFDQESRFSGRFARSVYRLLGWAWGQWPFQLWAILIANMGSRLTATLGPLLLGYWVDSLCQPVSRCGPVTGSFNHWQSQDYLVALGGLALVSFVLNGFTQSRLNSVSMQAVASMTHEAVYRTARAPARFLDRNPVGRILTRYSTDFSQLQLCLGPHATQIFIIATEVIFIVAVAAWATPWFIPLFLIIVLISVFIYRYHSMRIRELRRESTSERAPSIAHFTATAQGAAAIRSYGKQEEFGYEFKRLVQRYISRKSLADLSFQLYGLHLNMLTVAWILAAACGGVWLIGMQMLSAGQLGAILAYVTLISSLVQRFFTLISSVEQGFTALERLNEYIHNQLEPYSPLPAASRFSSGQLQQAHILQPGKLLEKPHLRLSGIHFRYGEDEPWILRGLELDVAPGEAVGIIGRTGCGKSSLFKVLQSLYPLQQGEMSLDSMVWGQLDGCQNSAYWRRHFAYIAQSPPLFRMSLRRNLDALGEHDDPDLMRVLREVGLGAWVAGLAGGLDTPIEENGGNLSAGQKQLIAVARCLLRPAPIMLVDEATSAVDPQTEELFLQALRGSFAGHTRLIIAHRLSTLSLCNRVVWLKDGKIHRQGETQKIIKEFQLTNSTG